MRTVLIHVGPSDTCPCDLCHGAEPMVLSDQGRDREYIDGAPEGVSFRALVAAVLILATFIGVALFIAGHK